MPSDFVDSICTDPPYGISFMNKDWDHGVPGAPFWAAALRVAKPGAHLLAFGGTRTFHRLVCAIEDAGWEIRDTVAWVHGQGFPKSLDVGKAIDRAAGAEREIVGPSMIHSRGKTTAFPKRPGEVNVIEGGRITKQTAERAVVTAPTTEAAKQWDGWGTALKPAFEPIIVARKPLSEKTVAANILKWGTGGINISKCRVGTGVRTYDLKGGENLNSLARPNGNDSDLAKGCGAYGIGAKQISIGKATVQGRWPANFCHDGSDQVIKGFPIAISRKYRKSTIHNHYPYKGGHNNKKDSTGTPDNYGDTGSAARFFYTAKVSKSERTCNGKVDNKHPTVKPLSLMRWLVRLVTPPNGIVLDPFCGSGSTGIAAIKEGFRFIGIEKEQDAIETAKGRIKNANTF